MNSSRAAQLLEPTIHCIQNKNITSKQQPNQHIQITTTNTLTRFMDYINTNETEIIYSNSLPNQTNNKHLDDKSIHTFLYKIIVGFLKSKLLSKSVQLPSENMLLQLIFGMKQQLTYLNNNEENSYPLSFIKQHLPTILILVLNDQSKNEVKEDIQNVINLSEVDLDIETKSLKSSSYGENGLYDAHSDTHSDTIGTNISATISDEQITHIKQSVPYINDNYILMIALLPKQLLMHDTLLSQFIKKCFNKYLAREYYVMREKLIVVFRTRVGNVKPTELEKRICVTLRDLGFGFVVVKLVKYGSKFIIPPISNINKMYSLVLDIDHTLINVRRWIDEVQVNDKLLYKNKLCVVVKMRKKIVFDRKSYNERYVRNYSFDKENPFGKFDSLLYEGDEYKKCYVIRLIKTKQIMICDENGNMTELFINEGPLKVDLMYCEDNMRDNTYVKPDLIYNNLYLVRFRNGLHEFFSKIIKYKHLEIILWTASVGNVYTNLMRQIQLKILYEMGMPLNTELWDVMLCREDCTECEHGYYKDLLRIGRNCDRVIIVDNSTFSFGNFESNLLPINNFYGGRNDKELYKLVNVLDEILICKTDINIPMELHVLALKYNFSSFKLKKMRKRMGLVQEISDETKKQKNGNELLGKSLLSCNMQKDNQLKDNEEKSLQDVKNKLNREIKQIEK